MNDEPPYQCVIGLIRRKIKGKWCYRVVLEYPDETYLSERVFNSQEEATSYAYQWALENHVSTSGRPN